MTSPRDLETLRKLAQDVLPGPWHVGAGDMRRDVRDDSGNCIAWCAMFPDRQAFANAAYIAALSPEVVMRLLDVAERGQAYFAHIDRFRALMTAGLSTEGDYREFDRLRADDERVEESLRTALKALEEQEVDRG